MTRERNRQINSMVQVVDSNGDKATDAIVNYKVYFYDYDDTETWIVADSGLMTHIGDGLYQAEWTPTTLGEYVFYAYSTNPKFHESYTYNIEKGAKNKIWVQQEAVALTIGTDTSEYYSVLSVQGGVRVDAVKFCQTNDESAQKNIGFRIIPDGGQDRGFSVGINNNTWFNVGLQSSAYGWTVSAESAAEQFFGVNYNTGHFPLSQPFTGRRIDISVACLDAPGTTQRIYVYCMYALLEDLDENDD